MRFIRIFGFLITLLVGVARAQTTTTTLPTPCPCNPAVTNTVYGDGLETMPDNYCHWNQPFNNSIAVLHTNVCWKHLPNTFVSGSTLDATGADSTAPCKTASSSPPTCTADKQCYENTTDHLIYICTATNTWTAVAKAAAYTVIDDEASPLTARRKLNFTGAGISCVDNSGSSRTDCTVPNIYGTVRDEGSPLTARPTLNFTGAAVTCVDNSGQSRTDCTVSGGAPGGSAGDLQINDSGTQFAGYAGAGCGSQCVQSIGTNGSVTCTPCGSSGTAYGTIQDEGLSLYGRSTLNFVDTGVSAADNGGSSRTDVTIDGTKTIVQEEGSDLTARDKINFISSSMTCVDNSGSSRTDCTVTAPTPAFEAPNDSVPNSAGTIDDEFNDNSFSGWTAINTSENGSTCTETESENAYLRVNCTKKTGGSQAIHSYVKTPPSAPYDVTMRFNGAQTEAVPQNMFEAGLTLRNSSNGRSLFCGSAYSNQFIFYTARMTVNSGSSALNTGLTSLDWWRGPLVVQYYKMHVTSTAMTCYVSTTAEGPWQFVGTETFSSHITGAGGSVDQVGFLLDIENNNTAAEMVLYYIRSDV